MRSPCTCWCCLVTKLCPTLHNPMDCSTSGFPVSHHLLESAQVHVSCISDTIQSSHPPLPSSPLPSIFPSIMVFSDESAVCIRGQCIEVSASASVLPKCIQRWFPLRLTGLISSLFKGLSRVFSSTAVRRHQFFGALPSLQFSSHNHTWSLGRSQPELYGPMLAE